MRYSDHSTRAGPAEAQVIGTLGELMAVSERLTVSSARLERARRLGALLSGNLAMLGRCATIAARGRIVVRVEQLTEAIGQLLAEANGHVDASRERADSARASARIDAILADQYRLQQAGLTEESLAGVA